MSYTVMEGVVGSEKPDVAGAGVRLSNELDVVSFYRAMHFSAKRGIAIACRLSVSLSVCPSVRPSVRL